MGHESGESSLFGLRDQFDMKILHTMLRIGDMERSIDFYTRVIGMNLLRRTDRPEQKYSLAFVAFGKGNADGNAELELTYNYGVDRYDLGSAFGHIAIGVVDIVGTCERIKANGGTVTREPGPVKGGSTVIAFVEDPDRYKIELIESGTSASSSAAGTATPPDPKRS